MYQKAREQATDLYNHFTLHICPGPRSVSYLIPFLALFFVLLIPPHLLSLRQIRTIILPVVYAFQLHVWYRHDSFDVISTNNALALFMLLGYYDVRDDLQARSPRQESKSHSQRRHSEGHRHSNTTITSPSAIPSEARLSASLGLASLQLSSTH